MVIKLARGAFQKKEKLNQTISFLFQIIIVSPSLPQMQWHVSQIFLKSPNKQESHVPKQIILDYKSITNSILQI